MKINKNTRLVQVEVENASNYNGDNKAHGIAHLTTEMYQNANMNISGAIIVCDYEDDEIDIVENVRESTVGLAVMNIQSNHLNYNDNITEGLYKALHEVLELTETEIDQFNQLNTELAKLDYDELTDIDNDETLFTIK